MVGQLKSSWHNSLSMIEEIRSGELNKYLVKPISYFPYNFMNFIGHNSLFYIIYSIILILFPVFFPGYAFLTFLQVLGFIISILISIYLSYSIYFCMVCFSFWFGEVRSLVVAYNISNIVLSPLSVFTDISGFSFVFP